ncbi:type II toxin-antitoxin system HicB family antitoxin [Leptotrichia sp. oral taxon 847]|uniref:type II toxin-antitoxin system HicB family antitoxin n=1 Tax=Leptotrichia sp. oral taxon 847 TaxID=1785996 RepID=UPI000767ECFF|nr:type II toxin-antitoxin system HicB family antitoxin [Leptotrichia sp. oral taxon 847]AMD94300.1 hypothetical protein AXF11_00950 [Leptotrichia sp. oral taxon 847]
MFVIYPAIFVKEKEGYSVLFPDFGGATCGENLEDAYYMATDYLGMNLLDYYKENKKFPKATSLENVNVKLYIKEIFENEKEVEETVKNSFKSLVGLDFQKYLKDVNVKSIRKNVTIPSWLNEAAKRSNINFSKVLQEALERELEID